MAFCDFNEPISSFVSKTILSKEKDYDMSLPLPTIDVSMAFDASMLRVSNLGNLACDCCYTNQK
jgi:hypothetical protein